MTDSMNCFMFLIIIYTSTAMYPVLQCLSLWVYCSAVTHQRLWYVVHDFYIVQFPRQCLTFLIQQCIFLYCFIIRTLCHISLVYMPHCLIMILRMSLFLLLLRFFAQFQGIQHRLWCIASWYNALQKVVFTLHYAFTGLTLFD